MLPKRLILGFGATLLVLGSLFGIACGDDEKTNGDATPGAEDATDTPEPDQTPE